MVDVTGGIFNVQLQTAVGRQGRLIANINSGIWRIKLKTQIII